MSDARRSQWNFAPARWRTRRRFSTTGKPWLLDRDEVRRSPIESDHEPDAQESQNRAQYPMDRWVTPRDVVPEEKRAPSDGDNDGKNRIVAGAPREPLRRARQLRCTDQGSEDQPREWVRWRIGSMSLHDDDT